MCSSPLVAVHYGNEVDFISGGKTKLTQKIKIHRVPLDYDLNSFLKLYGEENCYLIPCGKCPSCKLAYRKQWAVRCVCEASEYLENCFITLTYDENNCPSKLNKDDFEDFIKSLRNKGINFRFFGCGEGFPHRPHYHICLFGYMPDDLKYHSRSESGENMYNSDFLSSLWNKGFVRVQEFTNKTAAYVAGYVDKKIDDFEGFLKMSTHPGLGYEFYQKNKEIIFNYQQIYCNSSPSHISSVPRYFIKLLEKDGFDLTEFKLSRKFQSVSSSYNIARASGFDYIDKVFLLKSQIAEGRFKKLCRGF